MSILNRIPYLASTHPARFHLTPKFRGESLLLVDPPLGLLGDFESAGWAVEVLLTSRNLVVEDGAIVRFAHSELTREKYGAIVVPWSIAYMENPLDFIEEQKNALAHSGQLLIYFPNATYFSALIAKSTREIRPWPRDWPMGRSWTWAQLQSLNLDGEWIEQSDPQISEPGFPSWRFVDGGDVRVLLPQDLEAKRRSFVHGWIWQWSKSTPNAYESQIALIEEKLEQGQVELVETMIDSLYRQNPRDHRLANFRGILRFYENKPLDAYAEFLQSLELQPDFISAWQNAADAAHAIGRIQDLRVLYHSKKEKLGLGEIEGL